KEGHEGAGAAAITIHVDGGAATRLGAVLVNELVVEHDSGTVVGEDGAADTRGEVAVVGVVGQRDGLQRRGIQVAADQDAATPAVGVGLRGDVVADDV